MAIAAGGHSLALRSNGTVVTWGGGSETDVPSGLSNVVAIAAGNVHSLALCSNGTVVAWGANVEGQTNVPIKCYGMKAIAAGSSQSFALRPANLLLEGLSLSNDGCLSGVVASKPGIYQIFADVKDGIGAWVGKGLLICIDICVDDNGPNDPGDGDPNVSDPLADGTRYHPYDSIQKGIDVATDGMTVVVMDGYYTSTGNRDIQLNGKSITVRSLNGPANTLLEDFSTGFICNNNETTNTVIQGFSIHTWASYFGLEGIRIDGASPIIRDCNIWDCGVAGIFCTNGARPVIERTIVNGNSSGVRIYGSSPTISQCTIVSNNSDMGAGIYISGSSKPTIQNCLIANNASTVEGGGIYIGTGASPTNINCTIAGNSAVTRGGGVSSGGSPVFYNDIVYNNTAPANPGIYAFAAMTVQYSCLQSFYPGLGNKTNNPNLNTGDGYKLTAGSVAIDAGTVAFMPTVDLLGVPRPVDGDTNGTATVDMGCYEFIPAGLDSDSDGVPDWWTWQYFGHLSGQGSDYSMGTNIVPGSSMTTFEKYLADLNPTNPASVLAVTKVKWLPQGVEVDWEGGQAVKQYLESKSDLGNTNEPWTPVFTNLPPTSITNNVTVNAGTTNKAGFYRIRVER